jgi:hypothetical protein
MVAETTAVSVGLATAKNGLEINELLTWEKCIYIPLVLSITKNMVAIIVRDTYCVLMYNHVLLKIARAGKLLQTDFAVVLLDAFVQVEVAL